ncbi:MAG TPA: hypothetical protein VFS11_08360 [Gemmatimonadales bacterium]|nr:hypothetical protein [Gemmatimonadales bacterium]
MTASRSYNEVARLHEQLRELGFSQDISDTRHLHRWKTPDGDIVDLVPAGNHLGGTGQEWDAAALETRVALQVDDGLVIYHASAPAFPALKWAAHNDRGSGDPLASHDLEDILALIAARPTIVEEVASAPENVRAYVARQARALLSDAAFEDLAAGHLNNAQDPPRTIERVRTRLGGLAGDFEDLLDRD